MDDSRLRKFCSDITLQSDKEGFFNQWADQIEEFVTADDLKKFSQLASDKERFSMIWEFEFVHGLQIESFYTGKNPKVSEEKRQEGNKAFQVNDNSKALLLYSQAVIRAPSAGTDLSLSYANRSAALFHIKKYGLCLQDISLALAHGYPARLKYKVLDRRGQCLAKTGKTKEAKAAFEEALNALNESDLEEAKRGSLEKEIRAKIENIFGLKDEESLSDGGSDEAIYEENLYQGHSKALPRASSRLALKYSSETGRYMAASEDISSLKVLVKESPFSSVLMQQKRGLFCEHCFEKLIAPVPCDTCSGVAFCSPECKTTALKSYHKWECPYLNLFKASGMSLNCFLALRVVTERGIHYFRNIVYENLISSELPSQNSPYNAEDYKSFYNLVGLEGQRDPQDFLRRTLMATFLLKVLQHAKFFEANSSKAFCLREEELVLGALLLRHLQVIQFNAHEVSGICYEGRKSFKTCKSIYLGLAVYPTVSFFNHSCYPAVGRYFNGKEMSIVNLRPIKRGEMIAENYGPIFTHSTLVDRQKKLQSRYWFKCSCEACECDWPKYDKMSDLIALLSKSKTEAYQEANLKPQKKRNRNKKNKNKPLKENENESENESEMRSEIERSDSSVPDIDITTKAHIDFQLGKSLMDEFKREESIAAYKRCVEAVSNRVQLPCKDLHLALQALRLLVGARGSSYVNPK